MSECIHGMNQDSAKHTSKHTPEPWELIEDAAGFLVYTGRPSAFRLSLLRRDCTDYEQARREALSLIAEHNACAGIPDPAAALRMVRAAPQTAIDYHEEMHRRNQQAADIHNNSDGVGQRFDYMTVPPMPSFIATTRTALTALNGEG